MGSEVSDFFSRHPYSGQFLKTYLTRIPNYYRLFTVTLSIVDIRVFLREKKRSLPRGISSWAQNKCSREYLSSVWKPFHLSFRPVSRYWVWRTRECFQFKIIRFMFPQMWLQISNTEYLEIINISHKTKPAFYNCLLSRSQEPLAIPIRGHANLLHAVT
jgi:hypothetical protein